MGGPGGDRASWRGGREWIRWTRGGREVGGGCLGVVEVEACCAAGLARGGAGAADIGGI